MKRTFDPTSLLNKARQKISLKVPKHPEFSIGDTIRVSVKVKEGDKTRLQVYEGMVIAKHHKKGNEGSFTVRKMSYGIGVERVFPFNSPAVDRITVVSQGEVRRAKLYYLRALSGRKGRIKSEQVYGWTTEADTDVGAKSEDVVAAEEGAPEKKAAQA